MSDAKKVMGMMTIKFMETGNPVIDITGEVDPVNINFLRIHIQDAYDRQYLMAARERELATLAQRKKEIAETAKRKAKENIESAKLAEKAREEALELKTTEYEKKRKKVLLNNTKLEIERVLARVNKESPDAKTLTEQLVETEKALAELDKPKAKEVVEPAPSKPADAPAPVVEK